MASPEPPARNIMASPERESGQSERTSTTAEEGSYIGDLGGCTAPQYLNLHPQTLSGPSGLGFSNLGFRV